MKDTRTEKLDKVEAGDTSGVPHEVCRRGTRNEKPQIIELLDMQHVIG